MKITIDAYDPCGKVEVLKAMASLDGEFEMRTFLTYLANANGQKLSGYTRIEAKNMQEARAEYRRIHAGKRITWQDCEILADAA